MGKKSRTKGYQFERECVNALKALGVKAERVPLSGALGGKFGSHDIDIYLDGEENAPLIAEAKRRASLPAWVTDWLGENDVLLLREDRGETLVIQRLPKWVETIR